MQHANTRTHPDVMLLLLVGGGGWKLMFLIVCVLLRTKAETHV